MKKYILTAILIIVILASGVLVYKFWPVFQSEISPTIQPTVEPTIQSSPTPEPTDQPFVSNISPNPAVIGSAITVTGANLNGFEGDKNLWIENSAGQKGIIYGERAGDNTTIKFTLKDKYCSIDTSYSGAPCSSYIAIAPGTYDIYALPWGNMSNKVSFSVEK